MQSFRAVGFIKEYNDVPGAVALTDIGKTYKPLEPAQKELVCEHLKNQGILVVAWMGYFTDIETGQLICPDAYFTDGTWVWPAYLIYFLTLKPEIGLDPDFIKHVSNQKNRRPTSKELELIENELSLFL